MFLVLLFLFIAGLLLGFIVWYLESNRQGFKNVVSTIVRILFVVSVFVLMTGYLIAYLSIIKAGLYLFIPTLAIFLIRKTLTNKRSET